MSSGLSIEERQAFEDIEYDTYRLLDGHLLQLSSGERGVLADFLSQRQCVPALAFALKAFEGRKIQADPEAVQKALKWLDGDEW